MKKEKIIYWATTGLFSLAMLGSAFMYFTSPDVTKGFQHIGFPEYFKYELGAAKGIGALALLFPIPNRIKEWAYAGFGINLISAIIAHLASGDAVGEVVPIFVFFAILVTSYIYKEKQLA